MAPEPLVFESYQITLVSAPPAAAEEETPAALPQEELVVEQPDPEPPAEETPPPPKEEVKPDPVPPEPEPEKETPPPETRTEPDPEPTRTTEPTEEASEEAGADVNVRLEGLKRDYPAYYSTIIMEIKKCFRPPGSAARAVAVVYFVIRRDGTVSDARLVERSGNAAFDYAALGAVECAGSGRFGPLPDDLPYERLPIQFTFEPERVGGGPVGSPPDANEQRP